ncbi:MAG: isoleucine--tRNA ligase [Euryarchaeota archaeon]|nr:isoleucine--tRNA ligase [Euryarchaeota archaeon]
MAVPKPAGEYNPVDLEKATLSRWEDEKTFSRSVENRQDGPQFVFLEGPPTANGKPGIHHVVARTYKDLVCRWKTMEGNFVKRKGGWDTHGLPVEIEVQKRLNLMSKESIEEFGMAEFNQECRNSVWTYEKAWREMTERMAYWVDLDNPYVTLNNNYVESAWWALKQMYDNGLLFRGHKVLPYCPQTGTSYSSHEVALGYKEVEEPSVYIKFRLSGEGAQRFNNASVLAWTTTPWTLPGNVGLAVGPEVTYIRGKVVQEAGANWQGRGGAEVGEEVILAKELFKEVIRHQVEVIEEFSGSELVGLSYHPLFPDAVQRGDSESAWTILAADWVTTTDGTGVVHTAVMYGEDDYNLGMEVGLPAQHTVDMEGNFINGTHPELDGKYVKDCDDQILQILSAENLLYREKEYKHEYPHCWRTDHPLLYYAMDSWFVKMTSIKDRLLEFNDQVEWAPEWVGEGRFGEWLRNVKDWAISRERYWGTPLPVWRTEDGEMKCIGSIAELQQEVAKAVAAGIENPECPDDVDLHRPIVDGFTLVSDDGKPMQREPFVMDCWFDSGCASFAQWHHPFAGPEIFESQFPIDYICEGVDQTRGWFYTLLAVSASVFDSLCYKRCLSLGLILDANGKKMSKSKGNIVDPWDHFNREGADATRWYMVTAGAPWNPLKFDPNGVRETYGKLFLTLWNVYKFHADYAALDGFEPSEKPMPVENRTPLDRWILSRLHSVTLSYHSQFVSWDFHKAGRDLEDFVVNDLSNWYVRRSRRRLWDESANDDKRACQHTLHEVLITIAKLMAPISPFMVDEIYTNLAGESVHLADWPVVSMDGGEAGKSGEGDLDGKIIATNQPHLPPLDVGLEARMALARQLAESGRKIRVEAKRRQRLPCAEGWIVGGPDLTEFHDLLAEELNVEVISTESDLDRFQKIEIQPNRREIGKKCRADLPKVLAELADIEDHEVALADIEAGRLVLAGYPIELNDIEVRRLEKEGYAAATLEVGSDEAKIDVSLVLDMSQNANLLSKGMAREVVRRVQQKRKELDLEIEDTIKLQVWLPPAAPEILATDWAWLKNETRAGEASMTLADAPQGVDEFSVDDLIIKYQVSSE